MRNCRHLSLCALGWGGGVLIIRKRLQQLRGGVAVVCRTSPHTSVAAPPLWHLHSVKLPPLSVHDSLSPADSDNNAPCVWLQVLHPLLQPNRPLVIHFFSFVCRIPFPLCMDEWRFLPAENATLETLQIIHHNHHHHHHNHQPAAAHRKKKMSIICIVHLLD